MKCDRLPYTWARAPWWAQGGTRALLASSGQGCQDPALTCYSIASLTCSGC